MMKFQNWRYIFSKNLFFSLKISPYFNFRNQFLAGAQCTCKFMKINYISMNMFIFLLQKMESQ